MRRQCSLRLDLLPGETNLTWQVFDRLTGVNGGIVRTVSALHRSDPVKIIESFNYTVVKACNGANYQASLASLLVWGRNSCKEIFPEEIIRKLSLYDSGDILFMVPLDWADFPFEILYMQNGFLGQRFHIGTIINTGVPQGPEKHYNHGGDLMIIVDSSEKLKSVCHEGEVLKATAVKKKRQVRYVLQGDRQKLIAEIPNASIVHFAGHSSPDQEHTIAGWRLGNKNYFDTDDITKIGNSPVLPWLVFSNSCDGGRIMVNPGLSGIAGAFLSAGVHQVVGPFCKLNDIQAKCCTMSFYTWLFKGKSAAQALTLLRKKCPEGAGVTPMFYRLFGDPRYREPTKKKLWPKIVPLSVSIIMLLSLIIAGLNRLHEKITAATTTVDNGARKNGSGFILDLTVGGKNIHFSANFFAPTFIPSEPKVDQNARQHQSDSLIITTDSATTE